MILNESFNNSKDLWNNLNKQMQNELQAGCNNKIDINNPDAFFDTNNNKIDENKWSSSLDYSDSQLASESLIELFIKVSYKSWGINDINQIDPWRDILISIIDQLGFKQNENAFLAFLNTFYHKSSTKDIILSRTDIILLNNLWSDGILEANDLRGTGINGREKHIIFNRYLWTNKSSQLSDKENIIIDYEKLSEPNFVANLNIYAIDSMKGSPYFNRLKMFTENGTNGTGEASIRDTKTLLTIRNIIMFVDPTKPLDAIQSYYWIKRAINTGLSNKYLASATGSDRDNRLKKQNIYKNLSSLSNDEIKQLLAKLKQDGRI